MLAQEIDASPRLVVRASSLDEAARGLIEQACADSGFTGAVAFRDEPGCIPPPFSWNGRTAAPIMIRKCPPSASPRP